MDRGKAPCRVNLEKLGLAGRVLIVLRAAYDPERDRPFVLEAIPYSVEGPWLSLRLKLGNCEELVIGPRDEARKAFFR